MAEGGDTGFETVKELLRASDVAAAATVRRAENGIAYSKVGEIEVSDQDLARMVQAVPASIAGALREKTFYFVPLALAEGGGHRGATEETMVAPVYTPELGDEAICHRNVSLPGGQEGVFISVRLLNDRFAIAFEFLINVAHAFAERTGMPAEMADLIWSQAVAEVRGETSQDAYEARALALKDWGRPDEKARGEYLDYAYSDSLAIYQLSLAVDFDYSELREREYPSVMDELHTERLRLVAKLFPPNEGYEFSIRYRRRA